jgi:hypothetical protein
MYRYMWSSSLLPIDWWTLLASVALQPSLPHFPYIHVSFLLRNDRIQFGYTISIFLFLFINYYVIGHHNSHNQMSSKHASRKKRWKSFKMHGCSVYTKESQFTSFHCKTVFMWLFTISAFHQLGNLVLMFFELFYIVHLLNSQVSLLTHQYHSHMSV